MKFVFLIIALFQPMQMSWSETARQRLSQVILAPPVESPLEILLIGTIFHGNPYKGIALLKNETDRQIKAFRVGETIFFSAILIEVHRHKIILEKNNKLYFIVSNKFTEDDKASPPPSTDAKKARSEDGFERVGTDIKMTSHYRDALIKEKLKDILFQAEASPIIKGGKIIGFQILQIDKDSIFDKFGLADGDIITHINGKPLNNVAQTINFMHSLKEESDLEIKLERKGAPLDVNVKVR